MVDFDLKKIKEKEHIKEVKNAKKRDSSSSSYINSSDYDEQIGGNKLDNKNIFIEKKEKVLVKQRYDQKLSTEEKVALKKVLKEETDFKEQMMMLKKKKDQERGNSILYFNYYYRGKN